MEFFDDSLVCSTTRNMVFLVAVESFPHQDVAYPDFVRRFSAWSSFFFAQRR